MKFAVNFTNNLMIQKRTVGESYLARIASLVTIYFTPYLCNKLF